MSIETLRDDINRGIQTAEDRVRVLGEQEEGIKNNINTLNIELENLSKSILDRKSIISNLDNEIKKKNDEFQISINSSLDSLNNKEKQINKNELDYSDKLKDHESNLLDFNKRQENFEQMKSSLIQELKDLSLSLNKKLTEAIEDIQVI